jgi:hypothetical protein
MEQVANNFHRKLKLAYDLTPWRQQTRMVAWILLGLVVAAVLAAFYLDVSAKTAKLGRMIQEMQVNLDGAKSITAQPIPGQVVPMEEMQMEISSLRVKLAELTAESRLLERAREIGFAPVDTENVVFIKAPGYSPRRSVELAPPTAVQVASANAVQPPYRDSLLDVVEKNWRVFIDTLAREARK